MPSFTDEPEDLPEDTGTEEERNGRCKGDDDGVEYGDPRDAMDEILRRED